MGAFQRWMLISQKIFLVRGLFDGGFFEDFRKTLFLSYLGNQTKKCGVQGTLKCTSSPNCLR